MAYTFPVRVYHGNFHLLRIGLPQMQSSQQDVLVGVWDHSIWEEGT